MKVRIAIVVSVAAAVLVSQGTQAQGPAPGVSVASSANKIRPGDPAPSATLAEIHAARNEFEAFQIVVTGPASNVSMTASTLVGPGGASIPSANVRLYRLSYVDVTTASNNEGGTGRWPDALIPDLDEVANERRHAFPFSVPSAENRVVFVEVLVPIGQAAGNYQGSIAVTGTGIGSVAVPVTLRVWPFELPSTSSIASTFGIGWNAACVAHFGSYAACGGDAGVESTHLLYGRFMLDHRISADLVYTGPAGCSGPDCNWTHFDQTYGAFFDGTDPNLRLTGARPTTIRYIWTRDAAHYAAWAQHFRVRGWFDRTYDYTCDEPPNGCSWATITSRTATVRSADPDFRTLVTTNIDSANQNGVTSAIDIIAPVVNHLHDKADTPYSGNQRPKYDGFLSNPHKRLWWYQSCMSHGCYIQGGSYFSGWPSVMVDNTAVQARSQGILSWLYGVSGILYFAADLHLPQAWNQNGLYDFGGNGDGTLLYPGTPAAIGGQTHIPVASLRLKSLRDGFEDYEYMKLVADLGDPVFAEQTGRALFSSTFAARQPASALEQAREALAQRILELQGSTPGGSALSVTSALALTPASPAVAESVTAAFTVRNTGSQAVDVMYFLAGARNAANANVDFPASPAMTLQPGQQYTYQASRTFAASGSHSAWPAWYDGTSWHELGPHESFAVTPAVPITTRIEQDSADVVLGPNEWSWGTGSDPRASGGTHISASGGSATATLTFTGTAVSWIGNADSCSGQATVSVDGVSQTVDTYRATGGGWQQTLFTRSGLANGTHTFRVTATGVKHPASCAAWVYVDAFLVTR